MKPFFLPAQLFIVLLTLLIASNCQARQSPEVFLKQSSATVLAKVLANKAELQASPNKLLQLIEQDVLPLFDFQRMSQSILGRHWRSASQTEQTEFIEQFRLLLAKTYGSALLLYSGEDIVFKPAILKNKGKSAMVTSLISLADVMELEIKYRLRFAQENWKIIDITVGPFSLVGNYRTQYSKQITKIGVKGLIQKLEQNNQD